MLSQTETDSSINEILEMLKNYKLDSKRSDIDFEEKQFHTLNQLTSWVTSKENSLHQTTRRHPLSSKNNHPLQRTQATKSPSQKTVFDKLHQEKKQLDERRCRLLYETRRSLEKKQRQECTFSPYPRLRTESIGKEEFYRRNIEWLQRRAKELKMKQCEQSSQSISRLTFAPVINGVPRVKKEKAVAQCKGVEEYLKRVRRAQQQARQVERRREKPYSHVWNVRQHAV